MGEGWRNWSGAVTASPERIVRPRSEDELSAIVRAASERGQTVRVLGSGHSFVPLCATDGVLVELDDLQGIVTIDRDRRRVEVWAGTKLYQLGMPLRAEGLAMENLGDIDRQSLAGAISTGTHGTGRALRSLSTQVVGLRLVTAAGELFDIGADEATGTSDLLRAAALSLGAFGVITRVTLRVLPAYRLRERTWTESFDESLGRLEERVSGHRHFEFFWWPKTDRCFLKTLDPTLDPAAPRDAAAGERVGPSDHILPSLRFHKFNEIEYAVPAASGPACVRELRSLIVERFSALEWPLEYRTLAADELMLSPTGGRDVVTISAHQAAGLPHEAEFSAIESVLLDHGGRPHWGKWHSRGPEFFERAYPEWQSFLAVRRRLDPMGLFLNEYLAQLFGLDLVG